MREKFLEKTYANNDFKDIVFNRRSMRQFDPTYAINREEIMAMLEEATITPSACNLQSWHFVVVDNEESKAKVKAVTMPFNYPQLETAPVTVFIVGDTHSHKVYREVWTKVYQEGRITKKKLESIFSSFLPLYENGSQAFLEKDATLDSAMLAMQLLLIARAHGYEANAWAGYQAKDLIGTLGLDTERFVPIMAISIGKAGEEPLESTRYSIESKVNFL
ncbi:nitroreductase family protein [Tuanshanicoccus lijuaniae]|uniref:nitroreductase family protein n=1 Tax=Aerococcaceae bacterium zg-1292 TaxID=2774330 RepID=UPI001936FF1E|nr:nitroreductase family protein [Aerococcaceae bacterium zg-1292]QQA37385.1 nitroreductase family protein [Aerococcaceae bacterium zg-1292]